MAGLGTALNTALSALQANQIGLTVVSNNIANVNTPGYSASES
jgi:flagellar hook-associated protein FlgK